MTIDAFVKIPDELYFLRSAPITGSWAMLVGNPNAPRDCKLPAFCDEIGIRRMDVIWVFNEKISRTFLNFITGEKRSRGYRRRNYAYHSVMDMIVEHENWSDKKKKEYLIEKLDEDEVWSHFFSVDTQLTIFDANIGVNKVVRFYNGELNLFTEEKVQSYLECYTPVFFTGDDMSKNPLLEEHIRDLLGSYQVDGLTHNEALNEVIKMISSGDLDTKTTSNSLIQLQQKPLHYYKICDEAYYMYND